MLDTVAYGAFCQRVAGDYLHHIPHYGEPHSYHDTGYAAPREAGHARTGASLSLVLVTGCDGHGCRRSSYSARQQTCSK